MKTALLLNNTQLGPNHISVTSTSADTGDDDGSHFAKSASDGDEISQEDKPRARIFAEYLSQGYVIGDATIQRALELDSKHGVSSRFLNTLQQLDTKYHATDRAKTADESYGITDRANSLIAGLSSYFEKATNTPTGKKIVEFYENGAKQVQEVHAEARRLADLKKEDFGGSAVKAAGLERVFGEGKKEGESDAQTQGSGATSGAAGEGVGTMNPQIPGGNDVQPNIQPPNTGEKTGL